MAMKFHNNRQYPKYATAIITAQSYEPLKLIVPPRTIVLGTGGLAVVDAFAGTTPTITIGDNATVSKGYIEAEALDALAVHPLEADVAGTYYPAGAELTISFGGTVTAGSGKAIFYFGYLMEDAENELYGRSA